MSDTSNTKVNLNISDHQPDSMQMDERLYL